MSAVSLEARRGCQITQSWRVIDELINVCREYSETNRAPLLGQYVHLAPESSLQPLLLLFFLKSKLLKSKVQEHPIERII